MGRARASMHLIQKPKTKKVTLEKRGESLKKKASELSQLCDIDVCMIMYPPAGEDSAAEPPKIFPEDPQRVKDMIKLFNSVRADENRCKFSNVSSYFKDRKRKTEGELDKLQKKTREAKYPTWGEMFANLPEKSRRQFGSFLTAKIEEVKSRIDDMVKLNRNQTSTFTDMLTGGYPLPPNFAHPMYQNAPMNMMSNQLSQPMTSAGASTSTALPGHYMVEQYGDYSGVGRTYNLATMPAQPVYNVATMPTQPVYNVATMHSQQSYSVATMHQQQLQWKPCLLPAASAGMNGFGWRKNWNLGTSSDSEFKVDKREAL